MNLVVRLKTPIGKIWVYEHEYGFYFCSEDEDGAFKSDNFASIEELVLSLKQGISKKSAE